MEVIMKKKTLTFIPCFILIILMIGLIGCKSDPGPEKKQEPEPPFEYNGEELYRFWPFPLGVAVPGANTSNNSLNSTQNNALNSASPQYPLLKHFNVVVAENEMKPDNIMPTSADGSYRWENADALVNYAEANGKKIRGHVIIWHDQTPAWFFNGSGTSGRATKDELYTRMENHIKTVFKKYGGRIDTWDVCNEVVDHDNFGPRSGSKYTQIMEDAGLSGINRYEYVLKAFEWARQYADENGGQNVKLYLTDYGIERRFPDTPPDQKSKIDGFEELVDYLIEKEAPVDGVGFQGHFRLYDHPVEQISAGIDRFSAKTRKDGKKLTVQVCELDFSVFSNAKGEGNDQKIANSKIEERLTDLAATYRDYFDMFEQKYKEGKLTMVLVWGIADGHSWLNNHPVSGRTDHPLLFDRGYEPKEAFNKLVEDRIPLQ
jgi:endo-1,4-beta-xylanase